MAIKKFKPTSPGRRFMTVSTYEEITKTAPEKRLVESLKKSGGRNNLGRITMRHRGGGNKRKYRIVDFKRNNVGIPGKVAAVEYDPNRSARIALIFFADGDKRYILAPSGISVGDMVMSGPDADIKPGNAMKLKDMPVGTFIHNVELQPVGAASRPSAGTPPSSWPRKAICLRSYAQWRTPAHSSGMHGHHWSGRQRRARESLRRKGRKNPLARETSLRARHGHEPCGSSSGWRRRKDQGEQAPCLSLGYAGQGIPHAQAQAVGQTYRASPASEIGTRRCGKTDGTIIEERPLR